MPNFVEKVVAVDSIANFGADDSTMRWEVTTSSGAKVRCTDVVLAAGHAPDLYNTCSRTLGESTVGFYTYIANFFPYS